MSEYVVRRPPAVESRPPSKVWLIVGAVVLGLVAAFLSWLYLAFVWDFSRIYGNASPIASTPYALVPAIFIAGFVRCLLSLRNRTRPGLLVLLVVSAVVMGTAGFVVGVVGDGQNAAYRQAQTDVRLQDQRDMLLALPMNQREGGGAIGAPTCGTDLLCSIDVWVPGDTTEASLARMTAQMEAAGWTTEERGGSSAMYAGPTYIVEATVMQEDDKGGTDFRVAVIK